MLLQIGSEVFLGQIKPTGWFLLITELQANHGSILYGTL
jgi:hypothetical protein